MAQTQPDVQGQEIGIVVSYFSHVGAAVIKITQGSLKVGDALWIKGHTTDLKQTVDSIQVEHQPVSEATRDQQVGIKVQSRVRPHDRVYRL